MRRSSAFVSRAIVADASPPERYRFILNFLRMDYRLPSAQSDEWRDLKFEIAL